MLTPEEEAYVALHILQGGVLAICEICGEALPLYNSEPAWAFVHETRGFFRGYPNCIENGARSWGNANGPMMHKWEAINNGGYWIKPTRAMLTRAKKKGAKRGRKG